MYEGDTPNAERRAAALSLDRDLLRELLGQEELRELIDPAALDEVEADLQRAERAHAGGQRRRAPRRAARRGRPDRRRGPGALPRGRVGARACSATSRASGARCGCASAARSAGSPPRTPASTATRSARCRPAGCPRPSSRRSRSRSRGWCAATPAPTARSPPRELADRYGVDLGPVLRELERAGDLVRGELRPGGSEREWCDPEVLRRLRRASLATLRKEVEPAEQRALARFLPAWQGVDARAARRRRRRPPARAARAAAGPGAGARGVGARRAAAPGGRLLAGLDGPALRGRRARVGRRRRARAQLRQGGAATSARTRAGSARRRTRASAPTEPLHDAIRERLERGAAFWTDLLADLAEAEPVGAAGGALGPGLGGRGDQRRLRAAARAAARRSREERARRRAPLRAPPPPGRAAGAGPLVAHRAAVRRRARARPAHARARRAAARALRHRHPRDRAGRGHPRRLRRRSTASWPTSRRSAPPAAATSWRASAARSSRCPRRSSGCAALRSDEPAGAAGAGGHRPGQPLRRHAALAQARGRRLGPPPRRACRAPTW